MKKYLILADGNSPHTLKWIKEQAGGFMDDDKLIHFMIVSADYVLDTVSKYEPDEYYLSKLTCSDSTKISLCIIYCVTLLILADIV